MTFDEYQIKAKRTYNSGGFANLGMGIAGEAGEVCDYLKKVCFHGHTLEKERLCDELGDVAWYLAMIAHAADIPLEAVFSRNIDKLRKRYPDGFDPDRSIHRDS